MASRKTEDALYSMLLFIVALWPCNVTGITLAINSNTADYQLATQPGKFVTLQCAVWDHSQDEELLWLREDSEVSLKDGNKVNTSSICISIMEDDNGVSFTCQLARNKSIQISVLLDVRYAPILSGEDPPAVPEDWDVTLSCHVKAHPAAQLAWLKDNQTLDLETSRHGVYLTSELSELTIKRVQKSDDGIYTCVAHSSVGITQKAFHLVTEEAPLHSIHRQKSAFPHGGRHRRRHHPVPHSSLCYCGATREDFRVFQENNWLFKSYCTVKEFLSRGSLILWFLQRANTEEKP